MKQVNIHEAKTHLSALLEEVVLGDPFVIAKAGTPLALVTPYHRPDGRAPRIGFMAGQIRLPADFDDRLAGEIEELFYG